MLRCLCALALAQSCECICQETRGPRPLSHGGIGHVPGEGGSRSRLLKYLVQPLVLLAEVFR